MSKEDRKRPKKVRITKLQEMQIVHLKRIDRSCAELYWELGFDAAEVPTRTTEDFYSLPRAHAVRVAEADDVVAGFAAWRDEAPGVIYLEELAVHPDYQRFGIGRKLIERAFEEARENSFKEIVLRTWEKASWAQKFYEKLGFHAAADGPMPERVRVWLDEKTEGGRPFLRPGERVLWTKVPKGEEEEEEELEEEPENDDTPQDPDGS